MQDFVKIRWNICLQISYRRAKVTFQMLREILLEL
ncbi:hypothetical protein X975_05264, partial [Stegodyphus mimosarum]